MTKSANVGTIKHIYHDGDVKDLYTVGEYVTFKWHRKWKIDKVTFNSTNCKTSVRLIKVPDNE